MSTADSRPVSSPGRRGAALLVVVMGVSGSGKSSVGTRLAERLGLDYVEGDTLHPPENVDKMARGIPLDDTDREPWLDRIAERIATARRNGEGIVIGCSALKRRYRERLRRAADELRFVFLSGGYDLLLGRMSERTGHFMPASLLDSQFAALEPPTGEPGVVTVDITPAPEKIAETAAEKLAALEH